MTSNTKIIILAVLLVLITAGATLWISDLFRPEEEKKEYKEAEDKTEQLLKDLKQSENERIRLRAENAKLMEVLITQYNENQENYEKLNDLDLSNDQLDSLLTAFERKTGQYIGR